ncbi:MAG: hypothetical protein RR630_08145 [Coprobacillus sp.]
MNMNDSEYRERQEIIAEIQSLYQDVFDMEKNDLEDLTLGELKDYLEELSSKGPIISNVKTLLDDGHIDYDGLEEMEIGELLELLERLEDNNDK